MSRALGDPQNVRRRLQRRILPDHVPAQGLDDLLALQPFAGVEERHRQAGLRVELVDHLRVVHLDVLVLDRQPPEIRHRLAGELGLARVSPLEVEDDGEDVGAEPAAVPPFEVPQGADQDAQVLRLGGRVQRQDVEQVGQAPVALAQDAKRLGGQLGEDANAATHQVRPEHLRHAQVRAPRPPGVEQAEQVVEVEDVPALLGRAEDRLQPVFPLAHERHARDQPLGGQQPDVLTGEVWVLPAGDRAGDVLVDQRGLADQPRAEHQDWPAVVRAEQPGQLVDLAVASDRPVEVVGIEPVEAAPDALQLGLSFEDRLPSQRRPARILFLRRWDAAGLHLVDRERRDPRLARDRQFGRADEGVLVLALAHPEILGQDLGGADFEPFAARDLEPGGGQARRERQPSPQRLERRDQEPRPGRETASAR